MVDVLRDEGEAYARLRAAVVAVTTVRYDGITGEHRGDLTPPVDHGREIRCYIRDPDGHLIEVGQATGILDGA
jgi:catechol 2,3-dioxygenase-like lactoylglutathione lyase family enzyme